MLNWATQLKQSYLSIILDKTHYDSRTIPTNIGLNTYLYRVFPSPFQCWVLHASNLYKILYFTCIISYTWQICDWCIRRRSNWAMAHAAWMVGGGLFRRYLPPWRKLSIVTTLYPNCIVLKIVHTYTSHIRSEKFVFGKKRKITTLKGERWEGVLRNCYIFVYVSQNFWLWLQL